jgi:predicted XRE-type DNA-binding protein
MAKRIARIQVLRGSGNVFADLGLPNAEAEKTKVRLAVAINQVLQGRRLSQTMAAKRLGVGQPKVSALVNYKLSEFSIERLMRFLNVLGRDVEIVVRKSDRPRKAGRILVTAA